jgi:hypothetical protein
MKSLAIRNIILFLLLAGCSGGTTVSTHYSFPGETWKRFDNAVFDARISHPGVFYTMHLELEYDPALAPVQLPITVIMTAPSGEIRSRTLTLTTNPKQEKIRMPLRTEFAFMEKGTCVFEIENRSQYVETKGVKRIGVIMEAMD